jgi:hypothetical protein
MAEQLLLSLLGLSEIASHHQSLLVEYFVLKVVLVVVILGRRAVVGGLSGPGVGMLLFHDIYSMLIFWN